ncbi:arginase [Thiothrix litoralis]|jgi:arginase|uniref:Arginase n=1 Tax=Thiothrix litoralis TaxID=2891210 RepID=A0ABX7WPB8_9GAMM|nr:arginase [Thiothrix litoralis]QTR45469.1 arginase [Thiothrix litoralis]
MKNLRIIEVCSELGAAQLGASMGPDAIRMAAYQAGSDFFARHAIIRLPERNKLLADKHHNPGCPHVKRLRYILENCQTVCNTVTDTLEAGDFPLVLSADHSSAIGSIAGIKQAYPEERLGIIWIDAHSDMHSPYTTHSGNMHGMPLGAALGMDEQARILLGEKPNVLPLADQRQWNHLKALGGTLPKVLPEDLVLIGVRFFKPEHSILINDQGIKLYSVAMIREQGADFYAKLIHEQLQHCDRLYVSFDVDSLDCDVVSRGTGTPEPDGLYMDEALTLMQAIMTNPKVCCLEIAEVNPVLDDKGNAMGEAAWNILEKTIENRTHLPDSTLQR